MWVVKCLDKWLNGFEMEHIYLPRFTFVNTYIGIISQINKETIIFMDFCFTNCVWYLVLVGQVRMWGDGKNGMRRIVKVVQCSIRGLWMGAM